MNSTIVAPQTSDAAPLSFEITQLEERLEMTVIDKCDFLPTEFCFPPRYECRLPW